MKLRRRGIELAGLARILLVESVSVILNTGGLAGIPERGAAGQRPTVVRCPPG